MRFIRTDRSQGTIVCIEGALDALDSVHLIGDLLRRHPGAAVDVGHFLDGYEAAQWLGEERVRALQLSALRRLVTFAWSHVPHFARAVGARKMRQTDLTGLASSS